MAKKNKELTQKKQVMDVFFENGNKELHIREIAEITGILEPNVRRITGQNIVGKTDKPIFERTNRGVYRLITTFDGRNIKQEPAVKKGGKQDKVIEDFNEILRYNGFKTDEVQLIRHFSGLQNDMTETYYMLWKNNPKEFDIQTAWQRKNKFQNRKFLAVFVSTPANETLFAKFYKINGQDEKVREDGIGYFYNLSYDDTLKKYEGRS